MAGPKAWNALPSRLRGLVCKDTSRRHPNTHFLASTLIKLNQTLAFLDIAYVFYRGIVLRRH